MKSLAIVLSLLLAVHATGEESPVRTTQRENHGSDEHHRTRDTFSSRYSAVASTTVLGIPMK